MLKGGKHRYCFAKLEGGVCNIELMGLTVVNVDNMSSN